MKETCTICKAETDPQVTCDLCGDIICDDCVVDGGGVVCEVCGFTEPEIDKSKKIVDFFIFGGTEYE